MGVIKSRMKGCDYKIFYQSIVVKLFFYKLRLGLVLIKIQCREYKVNSPELSIITFNISQETFYRKKVIVLEKIIQ